MKKQKSLKNLKEWISNPNVDKKIKNEILRLNDDELYDSFYKKLEIGTAGIRGKIGVGSNRINHYTVSEFIYNYGLYIKKKCLNDKIVSVVIGYDTRLYSKYFAELSSKILLDMNIKVYIFPSFIPTPILSFAIKKLNCDGGIMITASHNPYNYNGIKLYNKSGGQITNSENKEFMEGFIEGFYKKRKRISLRKAEKIKKQLYVDYIKMLESLKKNTTEYDDYKIVFSPLHGTSIGIIEKVFKKLDYSYIITNSQNNPDPYFRTVSIPNPEFPFVFKEGLKVLEKHNGDICVCFDPDSDRLGAVCCDRVNKDEFYNYYFTGNEIAALLIYYLLDNNIYNLSSYKNCVIITTIVSSDLPKKIAESYGVETITTLTGFKNINEEIDLLSKNKKFLFAYEESNGYLMLDTVRDKDAFQACILLVEAGKYYKQKNISLTSLINYIYSKYGYYCDKSLSFINEDISSVNKLMSFFRSSFLRNTSLKIIKYIDVYNGTGYDVLLDNYFNVSFNKENVMKFYLEDDVWFAVRPSGTEPKIKVYIYSHSSSKVDAINKMKKVEKEINDIIYGEKYDK